MNTTYLNELSGNIDIDQNLNLTKSHIKQIGVVGGGFSGTAAIIGILRSVHEFKGSFEPLQINWYDQFGDFGRGLVYREAGKLHNSFILTQPASQMSLYPDNVISYEDWVGAKFNSSKADWKPANVFTSRQSYGDYLLSELNGWEKRLKGLGVKIIRHREEVKSVDSVGGDVHILGTRTSIRTDGIIFALGHERNDKFAKFTESKGYIADPFLSSAYQNLNNQVKVAANIVLIGGGPTSLDAIRSFEALGYQGKFHIIQNSPAKLWSYDPSVYTADSYRRFREEYIFNHLDPTNLQANITYRELLRRLKKEIKSAQGLGFGKGHVYYGLPLDDLIAVQRNISEDTTGVNLFASRVIFLRGAATAPASHTLINSLEYSGRLIRYIGEAIPDWSRSTTEGFKVIARHYSGRSLEVNGSLLVNCAQLSKNLKTKRCDHRLLASLTEGGYGEITNHGLLKSRKNPLPVRFIGPHASQNNGSGIRLGWGVESFRDEACLAGRWIVKNIFNKNRDE